MNDSPRLLELAAAVLAGRTVDWKAALEQTSDHRERALVRELESLAVIAGAQARLFSAPPVDEDGPFDAEQRSKPATISGYRVIRQIGEGMTGLVYEVEGGPAELNRGALKLIKWDIDVLEAIRRYKEIEPALKRLDHPQVARLVDVGASEQGRLYFVHEFVHGTPLTAYTRDLKIGYESRIEFFLSVSAALQDVHEKGLVHGDIRPNNVLVTRDRDQPVPKIVEIGVAQATQQRLLEFHLAALFGRPIPDWDYVAPEDLEVPKQRPDRARDLYGLGVLLYELCAGTPPLSLETPPMIDLDTLRRIVRTAAVPSLGSHLVQRPVAERRGLDAVVAKAVHKDPARRYHSITAMTDELRRVTSLFAD